MKKFLFFPFLLLLVACPRKQVPQKLSEETVPLPVEDTLQSLCKIPKNIASYIEANQDTFTPIDIEKRFSKEFWEYYQIHQGKGCPIICYGDFNADGQQDAALIIDYKGIGDRRAHV